MILCNLVKVEQRRKKLMTGRKGCCLQIWLLVGLEQIECLCSCDFMHFPARLTLGLQVIVRLKFAKLKCWAQDQPSCALHNLEVKGLRPGSSLELMWPAIAHVWALVIVICPSPVVVVVVRPSVVIIGTKLYGWTDSLETWWVGTLTKTGRTCLSFFNSMSLCGH